ncbi:MAG: inorganic phosphate transporter [Phycisphaerales bacterium]|nr:MAG: inorganic phosphate transporter [Phycisphaerales bacterium]
MLDVFSFSAAGLILAQSSESPSDLFLYLVVGLAAVMLVVNTVEVGRNDAANLVNAVFGARVLTRRWAVRVAGIGVVLGAVVSSGVVETVRKGIFHPGQLDPTQALTVYIAVYIVNTVLLYAYSAFGMPVSTTATVVFSLLGAAFSMNFFEVINWANSTTVISGIVCSIFLTGIAAFLVQRAVRGAIRERTQHLPTLLLHGAWAGGGMAAGLCYFMLLRGMASVDFVRRFNETVVAKYGDMIVVLVVWAVFAILIQAMLVIYRKKAAKWLFPILAIIGMLCMAFAFGQNDLANCASPALAIFNLYEHRDAGVAVATRVPIPIWGLFACGLLLVVGMRTKNAERVTKAEVRMGSMGDHVKLWAPNWCIVLGHAVLKLRGRGPALAPRAVRTERGKTTHYDTLRACVIMSVSASVIATASGLELPVSTTYVAFAAVVATGMADRIFQRGDAALKLGRAIWVVFSWFAAAVIAAVASGLVCRGIYHLGVVGILAALAANITVRMVVARRADAQEKRVRAETEERMHPEDFALEEE